MFVSLQIQNEKYSDLFSLLEVELRENLTLCAQSFDLFIDS